MRTRALLPVFAAAMVLVACDDRPTGPGNDLASDDAALRSTHTQSFGPLVLPATGTLADGGSFVGEVEIRRIDVDHTTGVFTVTGLLQGKATTADGKMKNCLFSENETDLLSALRRGEDVVPLIHQSIKAKAKELGGQFTADFQHLHAENIHNRSMITIGG